MEFITRVPNRTGSSLWPSHGAFYASSELTARFLFRRALFGTAGIAIPAANLATP